MTILKLYVLPEGYRAVNTFKNKLNKGKMSNFDIIIYSADFMNLFYVKFIFHHGYTNIVYVVSNNINNF